MRKLTGLVAAAAATGALACASASTLPGGPPDAEAPNVVGFNPDSGAVNFRGRAVVVQFDETVSDRGTGASALEALVLISPRDGEPRVSWSRNRIAVRPRDGFLPNTAYRITVGPGIADLRGNRSELAQTVVFSTGPTIPEGGVAGIVFDWPGQAFARTAWVEALRVADSAVFVAAADTSGEFLVAPLGAGTYVVRGYVDQNRNRVLDRSEAWDSVRVTITDSGVGGLELLLAPRDTMPATLRTVSVMDSLTLAMEFDKPLEPDQQFSPGQVRIVKADSTVIQVVGLFTRAQYDSTRAAAARDSAAARRDTMPRDTTTRDTMPRDTIVRDTTARDTTPEPRRPSRPAPPREFVVRVATPLEAGASYRVTATGFRTLAGRAAPATRVITLPRRAEPRVPAPADSARPPADTTRVPPADTTRATPPGRPGLR